MEERELTKGEMEIMQILWCKERAFVNDIISMMDEPKPAYTTVSTIIRILVKKGFVAYKSYGKTHEYYPLISKEEYSFLEMKRIKERFFSDSFSNMVSFFAKKESLSGREIDDIIKLLKEEE